MWQEIFPALRITIVFTVLTGFIYPGAVTGICHLFFKGKANGSFLSHNGRIVGSVLIGQNFAKQEYFHPRPSAAGSNGYEASLSGGSNLGPTSKKLAERVQAAVEAFRKENPDYTGPIPADLLTASASGLDPHVSPASAEAQVGRVARARGISRDKVRSLIADHTEPRTLRFIGEPCVNVLLLNLALDRQFPLPK